MPHIFSTKICSISLGGEAGIRTLGPASWSTVFETAPFDHSGTSPFDIQQVTRFSSS